MIFNSLKILVVEDNPGDFLLLKEMLRKLGVNIANIDNSIDIEATLKVLGTTSYDLIFLDLSLPDSFGTESYIRTEAACNNCPIIILSGSRDTEIALAVVKMGAQDFLIKGDFDIKVLDKAISYSIERKRNLDHIKHSKQNYESLFDKNPIPMWVYEVETLKFLFVNKSAEEQYGYSKEEFLSMDITDIRPPEEVEKLSKVLENKSSGTRAAGEWIHIKKNGERFFVEISSNDIIIDGKRGRLVLAQDITERKKAQSDIIFQANILKNITEIVIVTNLKGIIEYWNPGAVECYGYHPNEVIGRSITFMRNSKNNFSIPDMLDYLKENKIFNGRARIFTKHNVEVWVESQVSFMYDHEGNISGVLIISRNITEKVKTEGRLMLQKKVLDSVGMGILITDPYQKGNPIIYTNPKFLELTGYEEDEILDNDFNFLLGDKTNKEMTFRVRNSIRKHTHFQGQMLMYKKSGEYFWGFMVIDPVFDENGRVINHIAFIQDVTLQKKAEDELIYKNKELNTFIYRASHDLRSPIASLMGLAEIAKLEFKEEKVLSYFNMISQSSQRLDGILKNLLNLTAIKQGNPEYQELYLEDIVQEIVEGVENVPEYRDSKIVLDFEKPVKLISDKTILNSILQNLIENALKYKKLRNLDHMVFIRYARVNNKCQIIVSDNGIGIKKEGLSKVFDMFYRGNEASNGSGLGLYMVKNFVEKLGGNVEIFSEYQVGTTFVVDLPDR